MHESSERGVLLLNGAPMPEEVLARVLHLDNQTFNQTLTTLLTYGVAKRRASDSAIFSKRMVDDEKLCKIRRESGKLGGNPNLLKQKQTTLDKQNPTPSSSTSSSSSEDTAAAHGILDYLNKATGKAYRPVRANMDLIAARLKEGATIEDCHAVVDAKVAEWKSDPKWSSYLRPATLFSAKNFANYVGQISDVRSHVKDWV